MNLQMQYGRLKLDQLKLDASVFVKKGESIFLGDFKKIINFFIFCYELMLKKAQENNEDLNALDENALNNKLWILLNNNRGNFQLGLYHFTREQAEIDLETETIKGYTDIKVLIPNPNELSNETNSYTVESKRLNGDASKNEAYIANGIIDRYIQGKYCPKTNKAGMIGFVQKGKKTVSNQIQNIINDINNKLVTKHSRTDAEKLQNIQVENSFEHVYLSKHKREKNLCDISLYHLMFDLNFVF